MSDDPEFVCWAPHAEDLTDAVDAEVDRPGDLTFYYREKHREGDSTRMRQIFVTCSEGHTNVFEVPADRGAER